ncbi:rhythmically expressed gene 5 protein [Glossina fuscipes]|uniref:Rhythmically expressed gene 5 protein n=1 Tax=Glossina fuscipes TaxID=7396 RepID=A0A9C5YUS3_9MUSC|nr:rhythmically expressed gene 5 protein [Glossina fuscipes]
MYVVHLNVGKVLAACLLVNIAIITPTPTDSSSIPIWEFLTRNEKMSYLYSTFAQLVSVHCKATAATASIPVNQCKRDLLNYGYEKLQTFSDNQLDNFDPYQRGANELIWSSIMRNHPSSVLITTRKPLTTVSGTTLLVLNDEIPQNNTANAADTDTSETQHVKNPIFETDNEQQHQYAMDMDIAYGYGYPSMSHNPQVDVFDSSAHSNPSEEEKHRTYLTGPSVVRVRPDGTPVEEDRHKPLPQDDDLEVLNSSASSSATASTSTFPSSIPNYSYAGTTKHRKIATISALKQQYLNSLALQQQKLLPIYRQARERRHTVV